MTRSTSTSFAATATYLARMHSRKTGFIGSMRQTMSKYGLLLEALLVRLEPHLCIQNSVTTEKADYFQVKLVSPMLRNMC